ncbi:hypothetical protein Nepgr_005448 [Nepenthes gracilis]|uniref:Uncharacterized protein n=1 Tax=Nepenthes gracilis TaxID=150966 RepID=A0AAD3S3N8_NEPGR|nr:hypothetical protein Nepgr_005448 [Nepenthes gracilis]
MVLCYMAITWLPLMHSLEALVYRSCDIVISIISHNYASTRHASYTQISYPILVTFLSPSIIVFQVRMKQLGDSILLTIEPSVFWSLIPECCSAGVVFNFGVNLPASFCCSVTDKTNKTRMMKRGR